MHIGGKTSYPKGKALLPIIAIHIGILAEAKKTSLSYITLSYVT